MTISLSARPQALRCRFSGNAACGVDSGVSAVWRQTSVLVSRFTNVQVSRRARLRPPDILRNRTRGPGRLQRMVRAANVPRPFHDPKQLPPQIEPQAW